MWFALALALVGASADPPPRDDDGWVEIPDAGALLRDTDLDGVPDLVEARDPESDPEVPGLFPGTGPHIPEPLVFDMVRGLGARKGEVEINTLIMPRWTRGRQTLEWAPELEWAPRDDLALEIELPMANGHLHSFKGAIQGTLPRRRSPRFIDGWQLIGELLPGEQILETTALYLVGLRLNRRWSVLGMSGLRLDLGARPRSAALSLLVNPSVFIDLSERMTLGIEHNLALGLRGAVSAMLLPQFHFQMGRRWRLQFGIGAGLHGRRVNALGGLRVVFEL